MNAKHSRLQSPQVVYSKLSKLDGVCIKPGRPWSPGFINTEFFSPFVIYIVCMPNIVACIRLTLPVVVYSKLGKLDGVCIEPGRLWSPVVINTEFNFQFVIYIVFTQNIVSSSRLMWLVVVYSKLGTLDGVCI